MGQPIEPPLEKGQFRLFTDRDGVQRMGKILMVVYIENTLQRVTTYSDVLDDVEYDLDLRDVEVFERISHPLTEMEVIAWSAK